jgi:dolichyl-phosphate beta-glucosyltransferase
VRDGVLAAAGGLVLFADADGATPIAEEQQLRRAIAGGAALAVRTRYPHGGPATRRLARGLCGCLFARLAGRLLRLPVTGPQCGFKMFRRDVARQLFGLGRERGYLFDLELLLWARRLGHATAEVPVRWREVPGSKVRLVRDGWRLLHGLWRLSRTSMLASWNDAECRSREPSGTECSSPARLAGPTPRPRMR